MNNAQSENQDKKKKQVKIVIIIAVVALVVCIIASIIVGMNQNKATTTVAQTTITREIPTAEPGEEYDYTDEQGRKFKVTTNGTFIYNDQYGWIVYYEYDPISVYREYSYQYDNGTKCTLELKNDGTYSLTSIYTDGSKDILTGKAEINNGFLDSIDAISMYNTNVNNVDTLADLFKTTPENLDPNNVFHVKLVTCDSSKFYNQNGEEVTFEDSGVENFDYDEETSDNEEFLIDEFVLYLSKLDPEKTDSDGNKYYDIDCIGYSVRGGVLWAPWTQAGEMTASGYHYVDNN